jgi:hypothetical protein
MEYEHSDICGKFLEIYFNFDVNSDWSNGFACFAEELQTPETDGVTRLLGHGQSIFALHEKVCTKRLLFPSLSFRHFDRLSNMQQDVAFINYLTSRMEALGVAKN